jgi:hypothetical protein
VSYYVRHPVYHEDGYEVGYTTAPVDVDDVMFVDGYRPQVPAHDGWRLVSDKNGINVWAHIDPVPCYEDDDSRCACPACVNQPVIPGLRPNRQPPSQEPAAAPGYDWQPTQEQLDRIAEQAWTAQYADEDQA